MLLPVFLPHVRQHVQVTRQGVKVVVTKFLPIWVCVLSCFFRVLAVISSRDLGEWSFLYVLMLLGVRLRATGNRCLAVLQIMLVLTTYLLNPSNEIFAILDCSILCYLLSSLPPVYGPNVRFLPLVVPLLLWLGFLSVAVYPAAVTWILAPLAIFHHFFFCLLQVGSADTFREQRTLWYLALFPLTLVLLTLTPLFFSGFHLKWRCCVCHSNQTDQFLILGVCGHVYHLVCYNELKKNGLSECGLCKKPLEHWPPASVFLQHGLPCPEAT